MNRREAKRAALGMLARYARERSVVDESADTVADACRVRRAFVELAEELERRADGVRKPVVPLVDPNQLSCLDIDAVAS